MAVQLISANHAAAMAATLAGRANRNARGFGGGIYPITPQTECIEFLAAQEFEKGGVIPVESEHSAMAVCMGVSLAGARTFTASASNGLAFMAENVVAAGMYRLPILMMAVNRTLGPPWNIWVDHGDTLMLRDSGWMHIYCEDNQEVFDSILFGYRLAEDHRILMPIMICQDAFVLSHTMMQTDTSDQDQVDAFLPELDLPHRLRQDPVTIGGLDFPHETEVHRAQHQQAMDAVPAVYAEIQDEFEKVFGRRPADRVVSYRMEDAQYAVVSMGTTALTVKVAVDAMRERGIAVGAVRLRMLRPYPEREMMEALRGCEKVAILDRDISLGHGGVLWSETRGTVPAGCVVQGTMLGLGGGDIRPHHIVEVIEDLLGRTQAGAPVIKEVV